VAGTLFHAPEQRTSKAGKPFVTATIRAKDGDNSQWWRLVAFAESAQAELMCLTDGDALSVQGAHEAETYEKDGATKLSLSVIADHVLALRQTSKSSRQRQEPGAAKQDAPFDDAVPFNP
jgi:single-stranded DNA-binding protein